MVSFSRGGFELAVLPELGGTIARFAFRGKPVLRDAPTDVQSSGDCSCFPLVPYANRIAEGRFSFGGHSVVLPPAFPDQPHSLHGHGWRTFWQAEPVAAGGTETVLSLSYTHAADSWPWAYAARERFSLDDKGLTVRLTVENRSGDAMPAGLGLHPWFVRTKNTAVTAQVDGVWLTDPTLLPTEKAPADHFRDFSGGARLEDAPFIDNCHTGWHGPATIDQPDLGYRATLTAEHCGYLHLYAPVGSDFVCAEPVTAMPDAFNRPEPAAETGMSVLQPGERLEMSMRIAVAAL